jgi:hypothetical protein
MDGDRTAWLMLVLAMAAFFAISMASQSLPTGAVLAGLLAAATWQLWLPTRYELSAAGLTQRTLGRSRRIAWNEIAYIERRAAGLMLRTNADETIYLPYRQYKPDILALLDYYRAGC